MDFRYGYILVTFLQMSDGIPHSTGAPPVL
jgi:hypothetical protein